MSLTFEWDQNKAKSNLYKHGVSFVEASTVFGDLLSLTIRDTLCSSTHEQRFVTIGMCSRHQLLVVVHCDRRENIRIISARRATRRERKDYENS